MRVLWLVRPDLESQFGGDTVQILRTAGALRDLGVDVQLSSDPKPSFSGFDFVHLFHLDRLWENLPHCRRLATGSWPVALSTIWWPTLEFDAGGRTGFQGLLARSLGAGAYPSLKVAQRSTMGWLRAGLHPSRRPVLGFRRGVRSLLDSVRVLLPNSHAEAQIISDQFGWSGQTVIVPNAADASFFNSGNEADGGEVKRSGVLCVARIEPRKNQLTLIEALRGTGLHLTLVGESGRYSSAYEKQCRHAAGGDVTFAGALEPADVCASMRRAAVHVLPSWYETPGIASLEAALCGCAIVVTTGGCTHEYLGEYAQYADPADPSSLRRAVTTAVERGPQSPLPERIRTRFNWEQAAALTAGAYESGLASGD